MDFATLKAESDVYNENKDCAVKAVAVVTGKAYGYIHALMRKHGRLDRKGTTTFVTHKVLGELNVSVLPCRAKFRAKTVMKLEAELPRKGRFLVRTASHILACVDGKVIDWTAGRRHRIVEIFSVNLEGMKP